MPTRRSVPRQLRLFASSLRPNEDQRKRGLRWVARARAELERSGKTIPADEVVRLSDD